MARTWCLGRNMTIWNGLSRLWTFRSSKKISMHDPHPPVDRLHDPHTPLWIIPGPQGRGDRANDPQGGGMRIVRTEN